MLALRGQSGCHGLCCPQLLNSRTIWLQMVLLVWSDYVKGAALCLSISASPNLVVSSILSLLGLQSEEHMATLGHCDLLPLLPLLAPTEDDVIMCVVCFSFMPVLKGNSCVSTSRSMFFFLHIASLLIILVLPIKPRQPQRQPQSTNSVKKKAD